jgi:hypothetical protein
MRNLKVNNKGKYYFDRGNLLKEVDPRSFTDDVKNTIRLLVFNPDQENVPVGSFMFRSQKFSDIDLLDNKTFACCSLKEAKEFFKRKIQNMVYRISQYSDVWFSNVKAGLDSKGKGVKWTEQEILKGYKDFGGYYEDLGEAIAMNGVVNIEVWKKIMGRYIEMSNFLVMEYYDNHGQRHPLNAPMFDLIPRVKEDVEEYEKINTFKATKRMWILARLFLDYKMLEKLQIILSSDAGDLYIILSDIETIYLMLEKLGSQAPFDDLMKSIQEILMRLERIYSVPIDHELLIMKIKQILDPLTPRIRIINVLKEVHNYLKNELNIHTTKINKKLGIFPIPKKYLP